jgi:hypothetical protein
MDDPKYPWASRVMWASFVIALVTLLQAAGVKFGNVTVTQIVEVVLFALAIVVGVLRWRDERHPLVLRKPDPGLTISETWDKESS